MANSVMLPLGVMRPILLPVISVNQRLPSVRRHPSWVAAGCRDGELGDAATGGDAPDLIAMDLRKPEGYRLVLLTIRPGSCWAVGTGNSVSYRWG